MRDRVTTGEAAITRILLGGKVIVTARERSTLTITEVPGLSTIHLSSGRIAVAVDKSRMTGGERVDIRTPWPGCEARSSMAEVDASVTAIPGAPIAGAPATALSAAPAVGTAAAAVATASTPTVTPATPVLSSVPATTVVTAPVPASSPVSIKTYSTNHGSGSLQTSSGKQGRDGSNSGRR
jgi:hypothetical protein